MSRIDEEQAVQLPSDKAHAARSLSPSAPRRRRTARLRNISIGLSALIALFVWTRIAVRYPSAWDDFSSRVLSIPISSPIKHKEALHAASTTVPIWQTSPTSGWIQHDLDQNVTSALRSVAARFDNLTPGTSAELVASLPVFDIDRRKPSDRSQYVLLSDIERKLSYRAELSDGRRQQVTFEGVRYRWKYSFEVIFDVPSTFRWPEPAHETDSLDLRIFIERDGQVLASYDLGLSPIAVPKSRLAICNKPIYDPPTPQKLNDLLEWREHHHLMGVEVVHWSARSADYGKHIDELNRRTGRRDTFTHVPPLQPDSWYGYFDEQVLVNDCYARYRPATEWMAVLDHDEWIGLAPEAEWNARTVYAELESLPSNVTSAYLQWAWMDKKRSPSLTAARLRAVDSQLPMKEAESIAGLIETVDSYYYDYDPAQRYFYKSIHRTSQVLSASVHTAARTTLQGSAWKEKKGKDLPERTKELFAHRKTIGGLRAQHIRPTFEGYIPMAKFSPYPVTSSTIAFWRRLVARIEPLRDMADSVTNHDKLD